MTENIDTRICDYEGSDYRTRFWEGQGRDYEDQVERGVLKQLLPTQGKRLLEIGAGFGRLTNEYHAYKQVVLLDYSFSQLQYAREQLGDGRYLYVAADAYHLPFIAGAFDGATMIRVLHHFERVPAVMQAIRRVLAPQATFILEFANKRNLKALIRHRLGRQPWNPETLDPVEFVELNYNFHPTYIEQQLIQAGFKTDARIPVSFLRSGLLKRTLPTGLMVGVDRLLQKTNSLVAPSIFTRNQTTGDSPDQTDVSDLFACPQTGAPLRREGETLVNPDGLRWAIRDGIYDFKQPL
jgi:ubiquinone/menaquinone biosynthesis C-methylase UbiE